jgi:hypothetical protein
MVVGIDLTNEGLGSIFKRKDGKYFVYLPLALAEDTSFPFSVTKSRKVKVSFKPKEKRLVVEGL